MYNMRLFEKEIGVEKGMEYGTKAYKNHSIIHRGVLA